MAGQLSMGEGRRDRESSKILCTKPVCGPDQALIRVSCAGCCGSDLPICSKGMFAQTTSETRGCEFAGVIEPVGNRPSKSGSPDGLPLSLF